MDISEFCDKVEALVSKNYGQVDGGDLCYSLIEMGVVEIEDGEEAAARIVAQHLLQP